MNNPFQEQFLKAGVVTQKQVQKAKQSKGKKNKQQRAKKEVVIDETQLQAKKIAAEKEKRDRELNKQKNEQARNKAISIEIDQLIKNNCIARDDNCDIAYNFEHKSKIKHIYVNEEQKLKIIKGKLGIARIAGCYELVPLEIANKIEQRNAKRVVCYSEEQSQKDGHDEYEEYKIPDDLIW